MITFDMLRRSATACLIDEEIRNKYASDIRRYQELNDRIEKRTGYNLFQLDELFAKGYTLTPPDWISQQSFARKRDNTQDPDRVARYRRKIERLIKRSDNLQDAIDIIKERAT